MESKLYGKKKNWVERIFEFSHKYLAPIYYLGYFISSSLFIKDYTIKAWIMIIGLILTVIFIGYSFWINKNKKNGDRTKVILLLPLSSKENNYFIQKDVKQQLKGFSQIYYSRDAISHEIDFIIEDHKNVYDTAIKLMDHHYNNGTEYFVSTMGKVSERLATHIENTYKNHKIQPKLVVTVTGSNNYAEFNNNIVRFYVRLKEEVDILFNETKKYNSAGLICIPSNYGREFSCKFIEKWNTSRYKNNNGLGVVDSYILPSIDSVQLFEHYLSSIKSSLSLKEVLIIVLYGQATYDIIKLIRKLKLTPKLILFTSNFSYDVIPSQIKHSLIHFEWKSCVPNIKEGIYKKDVVEDFTTRTIDRLCKTIIDTKRNQTKRTFIEIWESHIDKDLVTSKNYGDDKIELRLIDKSNFN